MEKVYKVCLVETKTYTFEVKAGSVEEAQKKAENCYVSCQLPKGEAAQTISISE